MWSCSMTIKITKKKRLWIDDLVFKNVYEKLIKMHIRKHVHEKSTIIGKIYMKSFSSEHKNILK